MPALDDSPARIVQQALVALALADDPDVVPFAGDWPCFVERLPPKEPDQCVAVVNTLGQSDGRDQHTGALEAHFGFHVTVRARTGEAAYRRAELIRTGLVEDATGLVVGYGANGYRVNAATSVGQVFRIGVEPGGDRPRYTLTANLSVEPFAFAAPAAVYRFDGDLTDASGHGRDLTDPVGDPIGYGAGLFGQSGNAGSALRANDLLSGDAYAGTYSLSCWFYVSGASGVGRVELRGDDLGTLVSLNAHSAPSPANRRLDAAWGIAGQTVSSPLLTSGVWHHALLVAAGGVGTLYVDGAVVGTADLTGLGAGAFGSVADTVLASFGPTDSVRIDDAAVTAEALTADHAAYLWNGGTGRRYPT